MFMCKKTRGTANDTFVTILKTKNITNIHCSSLTTLHIARNRIPDRIELNRNYV